MTDAAPSRGPGDRALREATLLVESVYELTGGSMSPTLEPGWKVLVEPLERPPEAGDVLLIEGASGFLVHRCIGRVSLGSPLREHVIHAGDSSLARPGYAPVSQVRGCVRTIVRPDDRRLPTLAELPRATRRRFSRLRALGVLYGRLHRLAGAMPRIHRLLTGARAHAVRDPLQRPVDLLPVPSERPAEGQVVHPRQPEPRPLPIPASRRSSSSSGGRQSVGPTRPAG